MVLAVIGLVIIAGSTMFGLGYYMGNGFLHLTRKYVQEVEQHG